MYYFKTFVEEKGLVTTPKDDNDLFYHFPAIEDGIDTARQLQMILAQHGFDDRSQKEFFIGRTRFWQDTLAAFFAEKCGLRLVVCILFSSILIFWKLTVGRNTTISGIDSVSAN